MKKMLYYILATCIWIISAVHVTAKEIQWPGVKCGSRICNVGTHACKLSPAGKYSCQACNPGVCNDIPFDTDCTIPCKVIPEILGYKTDIKKLQVNMSEMTQIYSKLKVNISDLQEKNFNQSKEILGLQGELQTFMLLVYISLAWLALLSLLVCVKVFILFWKWYTRKKTGNDYLQSIKIDNTETTPLTGVKNETETLNLSDTKTKKTEETSTGKNTVTNDDNVSNTKNSDSGVDIGRNSGQDEKECSKISKASQDRTPQWLLESGAADHNPCCSANKLIGIPPTDDCQGVTSELCASNSAV